MGYFAGKFQRKGYFVILAKCLIQPLLWVLLLMKTLLFDECRARKMSGLALNDVWQNV